MESLKNELKTMSIHDLIEHVGTLKAQLFNLKIKIATSHVKDYSQFKKLRREIARTFTALRQKTQS